MMDSKREIEIKIGKRSIAVEADAFFALMAAATANIADELDMVRDDMNDDDWPNDVINNDPYIVSLQEKIDLANDLKHAAANYALCGDDSPLIDWRQRNDQAGNHR